MDYNKLVKKNPTPFGKMTNTIGQEIAFVECPWDGDEAPVICVCHALELASYSSFYELDDMTAEHGEYEPRFVDGKLQLGDD